MTCAPVLRLVGDEVRVPCVDGGHRRYLSFDAAAATGALPSVLQAVQELMPWYASMQGAPGYKSQASAVAYERARLAALTFADRGTAFDDTAVFCGSATEAIGYLAGRLRLGRDDVVVTTVAEHHANLLPWSAGASCRSVGCGTDGTFDAEDVIAALDQRPRPALLAITGASGLTGWMPPLREIIDAAHHRGVPVLADAAQLAPHHPLPADADFLVWSGRKMYSPFGTGVLTGPRRILTGRGRPGAATRVHELDAMWADPAQLEAGGSPDVIGAVAMHAVMDTLSDAGWPAIGAQERRIAAAMRRGLAAIPGVRLLGPGPGTQTLPIATFTVEGAPHALVAARLAAEHAIGVGHSRFGADPYLIRLLGLTTEQVLQHRDRARRGDRRAVPGAVRASAGINTTDEDVQRLLGAVARVAADDPPVPYHLDPSTGDFFPAASTLPDWAA